ncbi:MAG: hypothetical protein ACLSB9_33675 [Hydrogeniiclostridium mannosilyticum]
MELRTFFTAWRWRSSFFPPKQMWRIPSACSRLRRPGGASGYAGVPEVDILLQLSRAGIEVQVLEQVLISYLSGGRFPWTLPTVKPGPPCNLFGNEFAKGFSKSGTMPPFCGPGAGRQRRFCACDPARLTFFVDLFGDPDGLCSLVLISSQRFFGRIHNTLCSPLKLVTK